MYQELPTDRCGLGDVAVDEDEVESAVVEWNGSEVKLGLEKCVNAWEEAFVGRGAEEAEVEAEECLNDSCEEEGAESYLGVQHYGQQEQLLCFQDVGYIFSSFVDFSWLIPCSSKHAPGVSALR